MSYPFLCVVLILQLASWMKLTLNSAMIPRQPPIYGTSGESPVIYQPRYYYRLPSLISVLGRHDAKVLIAQNHFRPHQGLNQARCTRKSQRQGHQNLHRLILTSLSLVDLSQCLHREPCLSPQEDPCHPQRHCTES